MYSCTCNLYTYMLHAACNSCVSKRTSLTIAALRIFSSCHPHPRLPCRAGRATFTLFAFRARIGEAGWSNLSFLARRSSRIFRPSVLHTTIRVELFAETFTTLRFVILRSRRTPSGSAVSGNAALSCTEGNEQT